VRNILFLCTGNSARSIMAEAYLNHACGPHLNSSMTEAEVERRLKESAPRRCRAFSAGSNPTGKVNSYAIETLAAHSVSLGSWTACTKDTLRASSSPERTDSGILHAFRSKSWDEFAKPDAPMMDAVITVCDNAAGELCPVWPARDGKPPQKLHWSFPDPAAAEGSDADIRAAFEMVFADIRNHIDAFLAQSA